MAGKGDAMNCRCRKVLTAEMEVEYSRRLSEFFCSPDCAADAYFEYMESVPVDFTQELPDGVKVVDGKLLTHSEIVGIVV
jgi:hypothetical protein